MGCKQKRALQIEILHLLGGVQCFRIHGPDSRSWGRFTITPTRYMSFESFMSEKLEHLKHEVLNLEADLREIREILVENNIE